MTTIVISPSGAPSLYEAGIRTVYKINVPWDEALRGIQEARQRNTLYRIKIAEGRIAIDPFAVRIVREDPQVS